MELRAAAGLAQARRRMPRASEKDTRFLQEKRRVVQAVLNRRPPDQTLGLRGSGDVKGRRPMRHAVSGLLDFQAHLNALRTGLRGHRQQHHVALNRLVGLSSAACMGRIVRRPRGCVITSSHPCHA